MTGSHEVRGSIPLGSTKFFLLKKPTGDQPSTPKMGSGGLTSEIHNAHKTQSHAVNPPKST